MKTAFLIVLVAGSSLALGGKPDPWQRKPLRVSVDELATSPWLYRHKLVVFSGFYASTNWETPDNEFAHASQGVRVRVSSLHPNGDGTYFLSSGAGELPTRFWRKDGKFGPKTNYFIAQYGVKLSKSASTVYGVEVRFADCKPPAAFKEGQPITIRGVVGDKRDGPATPWPTSLIVYSDDTSHVH